MDDIRLEIVASVTLPPETLIVCVFPLPITPYVSICVAMHINNASRWQMYVIGSIMVAEKCMQSGKT